MWSRKGGGVGEGMGREGVGGGGWKVERCVGERMLGRCTRVEKERESGE